MIPSTPSVTAIRPSSVSVISLVGEFIISELQKLSVLASAAYHALLLCIREELSALCTKVENDTLSFKEGFCIFATGAICTQLVVWLWTLLP